MSEEKPLLYEHTAGLQAFAREVAKCWKGTTEGGCPELSPATDLPLCPVVSSGSFSVGMPP